MQWPLLDVLPGDQQKEIVANARRRRYARGEVIFHEGDTGDTLYLVAQGHVAIRMHTPLGDVATVRVIKPGEFFGELAVVSPGARNATALALDRVDTLLVDRDQLEKMRIDHAEIDRLLIEALVTEIRRLADALVEVMYVPVDKRVLRRVRDLTKTFGGADAPASEIPLTQEILAQLTGCTRPTANRVLRAAQEAGILVMSRGRIEVLDREALERRAR
jgi:CRP-like cAMP-binding protein